MAKKPAEYSERQFKLVPKSSGPGYVVAEILGADDLKPDVIRVRRWDTAGKEFGGTIGIKRTQIIGDVLPGDPRLAAIRQWCDVQIAEHESAERKRAEERAKKKVAS